MQAIYTNAIETRLRERWGRRRLDSITVEDVAELVRELRRAGKAEWTIAGVVKVANRTFKFAKRRMNWHGQNPVLELEKGERPKVSAAGRRSARLGRYGRRSASTWCVRQVRFPCAQGAT